MDKALSIIVFDVVELPPCYLEAYFRALATWNGDALRDVQIIVIGQRETTVDAERAADKYGIKADIVPAGHEFVDGYPIWDTLASIRKVWPSVSGRHVTFSHPEFLWGPDRVRRSIDYLSKNRPYFALGNLRRPGDHQAIVAQPTSDHCIREISDEFLAKFNENPDGARDAFEQMATSWWMFWTMQEQDPGPVYYIEDVFFADRAWLDAWAFTEHGGEMPFQDIYDLMRVAMATILPIHDVGAQTYRMSQHDHRMIHLWHPKHWSSWTPAIREWFLSQPERWAGTQYGNPFMWHRLLEVRGNMPKTYQPVNDLRNSPGGSVMRYGEDLDRFMIGGGRRQLEAFYRANGKDRRTR